jgi:hypothetical protein
MQWGLDRGELDTQGNGIEAGSNKVFNGVKSQLGASPLH